MLQRICAVLSVVSLAGCASSPLSSSPGLQSVVDQADRKGYETAVQINTSSGSYSLRVHSPRLSPLIKSEYNRSDLERISQELQPALAFRLDSRFLAQAADRDLVTESGASTDPTNYDAVWVRDNLWVALGLQTTTEGRAQATQLILTLADYFASPDQMGRFESVIERSSIVREPDGGMRVPHIRFDRNSPKFADVQDKGADQVWNHKQNDALGLFLDLFCREIAAKRIGARELTGNRQKLLKIFPLYFEAVKFSEMEDAGSWEEIERVNTSSIALVTSGLERLKEISAKSGVHSDRKLIQRLIDQGYLTIIKQLVFGGESPIYQKTDPKYRTADAALLNLIYPARLSVLKREHYTAVLEAIQPLVGEVGIKRYLGDSYQSGNFWFQAESHTDDTSTSDAFADRGKRLIAGSEAQWFFDSWLSVAYATLATKFKDPAYRAGQVKYFNRAVAQVTGGTTEQPILGADGKPVPPHALPESYNTVVDSRGKRVFAPSPITPLNWAKATLRLAVEELGKAVH